MRHVGRPRATLPIIREEIDGMEIKVTLQDIIIKDKETGEEFTVRTVRTAQEIASYIEESEQDEAIDKLQDVLSRSY